jgi:pyruvate dehydrogenase E2 component (dihydrolipoamide acetyltransferase)
MPIEVTMPKLSPTMETGVITQWLVKVGDQIKEGDVLAEIETDKATMPMKSYDDGTIVKIDHAAGDEVALGQRVMVLAKKGEDPQQVAATLGGGPAKSKPAAAGVSTGGNAESASPKPEAVDHGPDRTRGNGQQKPDAGNGRQAADEEPQDGSDTRRVKVSPLARKLAESSRIDLSQVRGSGPGGRIVRRDIEEFIEGSPGSGAAATVVAEPDRVRAAEAEPPPAASPAAAPAPPPRPSAAPLAAQRIPHTRMRKTIAQRMLQAKQAAPEIHLTVDIRADRLVAAREELNKRLAREGIKLSLGDFVTKAVALALRVHPGVNASFEADAIVRHGEVNMGIAVALPDGLIVPVLHRADTLGLREIRRQSEALAAAARANNLTGEQLSGSTFTISNLGMYGIRQFDAIINLPEVGILAVGAADKRPVVEGDRLVVGTVMTVTLTADHRAVDGAMAAEFLQTLKALLEEPTSMLL